jgi:hypothetical protein
MSVDGTVQNWLKVLPEAWQGNRENEDA